MDENRTLKTRLGLLAALGAAAVVLTAILCRAAAPAGFGP
jgi:hypothetical protein